MEPATTYRVVLTAIDNYERARQIARTLVSEQLAACCNILPGATSIYSWQNGVHEESEFLILIKTSHSLLGPVEQRIRELHPYEVPEIVSMRMEEASLPYLEWMHTALQP